MVDNLKVIEATKKMTDNGKIEWRNIPYTTPRFRYEGVMKDFLGKNLYFDFHEDNNVLRFIINDKKNPYVEIRCVDVDTASGWDYEESEALGDLMKTIQYKLNNYIECDLIEFIRMADIGE